MHFHKATVIFIQPKHIITMELFELIRDGAPMSAALRIAAAENPIKHLMRIGLPMKTIRHIYDPSPRKPYTNFRGSKSSSHL